MNPNSSHYDWRELIDGLPFHHDVDRFLEEFGDELVNEEQAEDRDLSGRIAIAKRVAECDAVLERALMDVEAPAGLADRLKARLAKTSIDLLDEAGDSERDTLQPTVVDRAGRQASGRAKSQRRTWIGWVAASLVISLLASGATIALVVLQQQPSVISRDHLAHESMEWKRAVDQREWSPGLPPQRDTYPVSQDVLTRPHRWMSLDTTYDPHAIVYDLTPAGQKQVLQFTLRTSREFNLDPVLPTEPIYETGSFCIGASYLDGVLYVVFVEGDARRYREVIWEVGPAG